MPTLCRDCFLFEEIVVAKCPNCGSRRLVSHKDLESLNIAHIDCDAFYAAIHKREDNALLDKPVIVGGGNRGVVATACYIARGYGIKSAMPMFRALKLCPDAIVIKPNMDLYSTAARKIREMMFALTPLVEPVSIDEAYLDLSGTERLHGKKPAQLVAELAKDIENQIGISVSIGLSVNKFLAKTASDMDKPRGFYALSQSDVQTILWPRKIGFLHGVGPQSVKKLNMTGYDTIEDIAKADPQKLFLTFGDFGNRIYKMAHGNDSRKLDTNSKRKSISSETTLFEDLDGKEALYPILKNLAERVAKSARKKNIAGITVSLKLKTASFRNINRQVTLNEPTQTARAMLNAIVPVFEREMGKGPYRLIGIGLNDLVSPENADLGDLINTKAQKHASLERALDKISDKFGNTAIIDMSRKTNETSNAKKT